MSSFLKKLRMDSDPVDIHNYWPPGSGSGYINQEWGSVDKDLKEIFTDLQHCSPQVSNSVQIGVLQKIKVQVHKEQRFPVATKSSPILASLT
jgi:hypothetical protein